MPSTQNILDVGGVPHSQELMPVAAAEKNAGEMGSPTQSQEAAYREHNQVPASQIRSAEILDVADQGRGIAPSTESITVGIGGVATAIASPLYLLASEIVDVVTKGHEQ